MPSDIFRTVSAALVLIAGMANPVMADVRLALVVGIGNYQAVQPLDNPVNDATLIAESLTDQGFVVTLITDPDQGAFIRGVSEFGRTLREAGEDATGLFYYAGHGVQSFGTNYLLPTDASLIDAADLDLVAIQADTILRQMASARNRTNIVILDACRNNPFETIPALNDNGLAEMKAPKGTFLAYSTGPGSVAVDGEGSNSPFTFALSKAILKPGQIIEEVFKEVRVEVLAQTGGLQVPWDSSSLIEDFVFSQEPTLTPEQIAQEQLWAAVEVTRDPIQIMLFLRANPNSHLKEAARALLRDVMAEEMKVEPTAEPQIAEVNPETPPKASNTPTADEKDAFEVARAQASTQAYEQFLSENPDSVFTEIARIELNALVASRSATQNGESPVGTGTESEIALAVADTDSTAPVSFGQPLATGSPEVVGRSISELIEGIPLFAPIEGLPDEAWKGKSCSGCHSWTRDALCTQGSTYIAGKSVRAIEKTHPYGGGFKTAIMKWASADCP